MTKEKIMKMIKKLKTAAYAAPLAVLAALPMTANAALNEGVKNAINGGFSDAQEGAGLRMPTSRRFLPSSPKTA